MYIATVGDSIEREGVEHLLEVADRFGSDAVVSKPRFVDEAGHALPDDRWPVDEIVERLEVASPTELTLAEMFLFATTNAWGRSSAARPAISIWPNVSRSVRFRCVTGPAAMAPGGSRTRLAFA